MRSPIIQNVIAVCLTLLTITHKPVDALRGFRRRSDMEDLPPPSSLNLSVPLQGGTTCESPGHCTDELSEPSSGSTLQYVAIARGITTYRCPSQDPTEAPVYVSQDTNLYNAVPLIMALGSEERFHNLIPQFLEYDYTSLDNSTLTCIGNIGTYQGVNAIDLFSEAVFPVEILETIHAPSEPTGDLDWAHEQSNDKKWDIYRVMTAGGAPPLSCHQQGSNIELHYAAEYWFFRE